MGISKTNGMYQSKMKTGPKPATMRPQMSTNGMQSVIGKRVGNFAKANSNKPTTTKIN